MVPMGDQAARTLTWYLTQSHHRATELTVPLLILFMPSDGLGNNKYQSILYGIGLTQLGLEALANLAIASSLAHM